jgi:hypothetical protein
MENQMKMTLAAAALPGGTTFANAAGFTLESPDIKPNSTPHKADKLDIAADPTAALAGFNINRNAVAKASFMAKYGSPK